MHSEQCTTFNIETYLVSECKADKVEDSLLEVVKNIQMTFQVWLVVILEHVVTNHKTSQLEGKC